MFCSVSCEDKHFMMIWSVQKNYPYRSNEIKPVTLRYRTLAKKLKFCCWCGNTAQRQTKKASIVSAIALAAALLVES